jgi:hypothetical protein
MYLNGMKVSAASATGGCGDWQRRLVRHGVAIESKPGVSVPTLAGLGYAPAIEIAGCLGSKQQMVDWCTDGAQE